MAWAAPQVRCMPCNLVFFEYSITSWVNRIFAWNPCGCCGAGQCICLIGHVRLSDRSRCLSDRPCVPVGKATLVYPNCGRVVDVYDMHHNLIRWRRICCSGGLLSKFCSFDGKHITIVYGLAGPDGFFVKLAQGCLDSVSARVESIFCCPCITPDMHYQ